MSSNGNETRDSIPKISLTETEDLMRRLLMDVATHVNPSNPSVLRFSGGWVRDKLLGVTSHDIDVSINDMTGYTFGLHMKEYLELPGKAEQYGITGTISKGGKDAGKVFSGLHKIEANPEKSKHLETVTTRIFGLDIDLVNLRKETYTADSRNPTMEFGTAEEDALRRDATVNAMFYNLNTQEVEDLTHKGWDDMRRKMIRTPLEPYQTFEDDPLRILRLIRFACRLGYEVDGETYKAMGIERVKKALEKKISRERIGVEIEKMLKGPDPQRALQMIQDIGLYDCILVNPQKSFDHTPNITETPLPLACASRIMQQSDSSTAILFENNPEQAFLIWTLCALIPWADAPLPPPSKKNGKPHPHPAVEVARNGLKAPNKVCDVVRDSLSHLTEITNVKDDFIRHRRTSKSSEPGTPSGRDTIGMAIRRWGPSWTSQVAFAMMLEVWQSKGSERDIFKEYTDLLDQIALLSLQNASSLKPILDGRTLSNALSTPSGAWLKSALDTVMAYQLAHPDATVEGAVAAVRASKGELATRLVSHILSLTIRPLFAQTKTTTEMGVTPAGRRMMQPTANNRLPSRSVASIESESEAIARRPWKLADESYALDLLKWCVYGLAEEPARTERCWPLLVPPLLAIIDDTETRFKVLGCKLLTALFNATSPQLLHRTGLGDVFRSAIKPILSYLPTLTPEDESIVLLDAAYPAMFALADITTPAARNDTANLPTTDPRTEALTTLLHSNLLASLAFTSPSTYPSLSACLLTHLATCAHALGLHTAAHLQDIIPLLGKLMTDPFLAHAPATVTQAAATTRDVLDVAWPRVWRWRGQVLEGLCGAWVNLDEAEVSGPEVDVAKDALKECVETLVKAVEKVTRETGLFLAGEREERDSIDLQAELAILVEAEPGLAGLLGRGGDGRSG